MCHLVLGLLRDGRPRHGYRLMMDHAVHLGEPANAGGIYRGLRRLAAEGLVTKLPSPPEADARRVPYEITEEGRRVFDAWLAHPRVDDTTFAVWLVFFDRLPVAARERVLDRREEHLCKRRERLARECTRRVAESQDGDGCNPVPAPLGRRLKLLGTELECLRELRLEIQDPLEPGWSQTEGRVESSPTGGC